MCETGRGARSIRSSGNFFSKRSERSWYGNNKNTRRHGVELENQRLLAVTYGRRGICEFYSFRICSVDGRQTRLQIELNNKNINPTISPSNQLGG